MKIQLIKEVNYKGETWFSIEKDGYYLAGSITRNFEEAVENYNRVLEANQTREILMETEIDY
jgi:hypothetical protein